MIGNFNLSLLPSLLVLTRKRRSQDFMCLNWINYDRKYKYMLFRNKATIQSLSHIDIATKATRKVEVKLIDFGDGFY